MTQILVSRGSKEVQKGVHQRYNCSISTLYIPDTFQCLVRQNYLIYRLLDIQRERSRARELAGFNSDV